MCSETREGIRRADSVVFVFSGQGSQWVEMGRRLWEQEPVDNRKDESVRDYETVGYVINGRAELVLEGQTIRLEPGDSWLVPAGARHAYKILEPFTAVEATAPPSQVHGRDEPRGADWPERL